MKKVTYHQTHDCNAAITITADEPNPAYGGASHTYFCKWTNAVGEANAIVVQFQKGPVKEKGINGIQHEALLAILIDRLTDFQAGPYASEHNQNALDACQAALRAHDRRTEERIARNVEGRNIV